MFLSDVFDQLSYGELSEIAIGGTDSGGIAAEDYPQMVMHVNSALTTLHSRLPLRFEEVHIQQYDHIQNYHLKSKYAVFNDASAEPIRYLIDSIYQPFVDNVLKIEQVFSEEGEERSINDRGDTWSVYTPDPKTVLVPFNDGNNTFSVIYRANHEKIDASTDIVPADIEVNIPEFLLEPLSIYVAGRIVGNMGSADNLNASSQYTSRFELALFQITELDLLNKSALHNDRLEMKGWA